MQQRQQSGVGSQQRVPVNTRGTAELVGVASDYRLPGVTWDYYNTVTKMLKYTYEWPEGMAAHFAWQGEGQWRTINLWRNTELLERYFAEVAIERISHAIELLGAVANREGATDVEPVQHAVTKLILGPRSRAFAGVSEDRDGEAIHALGGEPFALELEIGDMTAEHYALLIAQLGYEDSVPSELISHHSMVDDNGMRVFETWADRGHALAALGGVVLPAVERLGAKLGQDFLCIHEEHLMRRIALRPDAISAFGF